MRKVLNSISMDGVVIIGEGEKDEVCCRLTYAHTCSLLSALCTILRVCMQDRHHPHVLLCARVCVYVSLSQAPMLYCGERIGDRTGMKVDIAVDPLDGTTLTAQGRNGAISVIAVAERGALFDPGPCV